MNLMQMPPQIEDGVRGAVNAVSEVPWTRTLAAGTLLTSAALLFTGKRKASLATAVAGAAILLLEEPEAVRRFWNKIPDYVRASEQFLGRVEGYVEQFAEQGERVKKVLRRD
jgi:hypothetical protein